jgi:mevalonate kinase
VVVYSAFGPGKIILLGEHGVVYGHPALAAPISRGVRAKAFPSKTLSLEMPEGLTAEQQGVLARAFAVAAKAAKAKRLMVVLESNLPVSLGLGSSGALSVACARVLLESARGRPPKEAEVEALALKMEKEFHGTPSGVDHTTSALGTMVLYQKGTARPVVAPIPVKVLVALIDGRSPTRATVGALRHRQAKWPARYGRYFKEMGTLAAEGAKAVRAGDLDALGDAMNLNQGVLSAVGLSGERIDAMVRLLRRHGALGAKLTGAGGDGGAVIGLFPEPEPVVSRLLKLGVQCFTSQLAGPRAL